MFNDILLVETYGDGYLDIVVYSCNQLNLSCYMVHIVLDYLVALIKLEVSSNNLTDDLSLALHLSISLHNSSSSLSLLFDTIRINSNKNILAQLSSAVQEKDLVFV